MFGDFHSLIDMLHSVRKCHDCGKQLKFKEIRRCEKCKKIYKENKKKKK